VAWSLRGVAWHAALDGVSVLLNAFLLSPNARRRRAAAEIRHATAPLARRAPVQRLPPENWTTERRPAPAPDNALFFPKLDLEPEWREQLSTFLDAQDYGVV